MSVEAAPPGTRTMWLSGAILTFLSKVVMPVLWSAFLIGAPVWVYLSVGRFAIRPDFQFIAWFAVIATIPLPWVTIHLQLVGYRGRELVIGNYWREGSVPFEAVQAVEPVWWYRGRLVRIRFKNRTAFGTVVYYLPKWGPLRTMLSSPEEALKRIVGLV